MQSFSIAWRLLLNLVIFAVILAMFHFAHSPFETIVMSALVLIYVAVINSHMGLGYALAKKWDMDLAHYISIARSLGLKTELEEDAQKRDREKDRKGGQVGFWITNSFNMLFGVIAIGHLVYAIKSQVP